MNHVSDPEELLTRRMLDTFGVPSSHDLAVERKKYGPMSKAYLALAARIVDHSGVVGRLEEWHKENRKSNAGAKPYIPFRAVLILLLIHIQMGHGANYQEIAHTLAHRFDPEHRRMLGIVEGSGTHKEWYLRMWRSTNTMLAQMDPYPSRRNKRLSEGEYAAQVAKWESTQGRIDTKIMLARLDWLCEKLVHTTVRMLPKDIWDRYAGNIAIDATKMEIAGRPNAPDPRRKRSNADPFAGRYRREGNHDGQGAKTDVAAYELENAVMVWNRPGERHMFPSLTLAVTFHRPGRLVGHGLRLVQSVERLGVRPGLILADRAYNGERIENFQIPVRLLGWELVIDYPKNYLGEQSSYEDLILVDGSWYVTYMPQALIDGSKKIRKEVKDPVTGDKKTVVDEAERERLIRAREPYRMIPKGRPDKDGYQRFTYPRPGSYLAYDRGAKKVITPTTARTITIPIDAGDKPTKQNKKPVPAIKHVQKYPYLSEEHQGFYGMRSLVESSHRVLKDSNREDIANPAKRTGRGYAFHYLAVALAAASTNLRKIETFFMADYERMTAPKHRARRRKTVNGSEPLRALPNSTAPPA
ncbi:hypothetical protein [Leifsonia virtsii]|uniref:Transposase n=1 Tax=Leifsonia virtsii TaxID=3035915 RepID=A0ABT8IYX8_9MICO|nr:hypothetical protein [Leifsonia virtsii]MDN4598025.1 hypothetical protein [Leifsonia virtsii]